MTRNIAVCIAASLWLLTVGVCEAPAVERVFAFSKKPAVVKNGDEYVITFTAAEACDVTVSVVNKKGTIVRHLASGVLGSNAPAPFTSGTLEQSLTWDGTNDAGEPAAAGASIRVSLGLNAVFDKTILNVRGWDTVRGLSVTPTGDLCVLSCNKRIAIPFLQIFDGKGAYQRTVMPPPTGTTAEQFPLIKWAKTTWDATVPLSRNSIGLYPLENFTALRQHPPVTRDGRLLWVTSSRTEIAHRQTGRRLMMVNTTDGAMPTIAVRQLTKRFNVMAPTGMLGNGAVYMALSPDEKWLYFGSHDMSSKGDDRAKKSFHGVYRARFDEPGELELFLGNQLESGEDNEHFNQPRGVACDGVGNVYVADFRNDRIQVFSSAGDYRETIPVQRPSQIHVHPKTGDIYVLCKPPAAKKKNKKKKQQPPQPPRKLIKLAGVKGHAVEAVLEGRIETFCLDTTTATPSLWIAEWSGVWRVEDRGDRLEKTVSLDSSALGPPSPKEQGSPIFGHTPSADERIYITTDPYREEVYVKAPSTCYGAPLTRLDGRTGKVIETLLPVRDSYIGPDGMLYMRSRTHAQHYWIIKYNPDTHEYLPFPQNDFPVNGQVRADMPASVPDGPYFGTPGEHGSRNYQALITVAANNDIYVPVRFSKPMAELFKKAKIALPAKVSGAYSYLTVLTSEGKLKNLSAILGSTRMQGSPAHRVGPSGAVYMGLNAHSVDRTVPEGLKPDAVTSVHWGTLFKFDGKFDTFPVGEVEQGKQVTNPTHKGKHPSGPHRDVANCRFKNVAWTYDGLAPVIHGGCTCLGYSFDVDRFERIFVPAAHTCTVNVLDANGNIMLRAGEYGNVDSPGPVTGFILPQYLGVTDEALYVYDGANFRVVRMRLVYHTEESLPVH